MNILLINPPCRSAYLLPLGLGYIASVIRDKGHNVKILDINALEYSPEKVRQILKNLDFDIAGIGGLTTTYGYVKWLSHAIKKDRPHVPIVAGNMVSTAHPELLLKNSSVDIAVIDEGELTFKDIVSAIESNRDIGGIKGIFYKDSSKKIIKNPPRERITDLDLLPFPAWDLFPMEVYLNNSRLSSSTGLASINISTVRGCPYSCTFCSRQFGRKVYTRFAKGIVDEIKELKIRYKIKSIAFSDDLFLVNEERVLELCDRIIFDKIDIKWSTSGRVNLVNDNLLKKMHKAGCIELSFGFESGSQDMLNRMNKAVTVAQAEKAIKITRKAGIRVLGSFIFGMPGETHESIKETLAFIKRTQLPMYRFFYATPYPKTELYEIAMKTGKIPEDEDKYVESLGEMRTTFLVNLTDFSDIELVRLKNLAEQTARRNLSLKYKFEEFAEDWHRRLVTTRLSLRNAGISLTIKKIFSKILQKLKKIIMAG